MFDSHEKLTGFIPQILGIPTYSVFLFLAILSGVLYYFWDANKRKVHNDSAVLIVVSALFFGMIGSKIPLILEGLDFSLILTGKSIVGGLIGGFLGVIFVKKIFHINLRLGNTIAPCVALGMAVGRLGCFFGGCCYGKIASWGFDFGDGNLRLPTQLFEVAFHLTAFLVLHHFKKKTPMNGLLFKMYLLCYFVFRFFIEFIRENRIVWANLTIYQILSLVCFVFLGVVSLRRYVFCRRSGKES